MAITTQVSLNARQVDSERLVHAFTAVLFLLVAVTGFGPNSAAIVGGALPNPPLAIHVHAALMTTWLLVLVTQSVLKVSAHHALHRRLGLAAFGLAPLLFVGMLVVTRVGYMRAVEIGTMPVPLAANIMSLQIRALILFPLFFVWAMRVRRRDPGTHQRLVLMATLVLMDAALARMAWLPGAANVMESYDLIHAWQLLLLAPALLHDQLRLGRIHRAWILGIGIYLPFIILTHFLWNSPWWLNTAARIMGAP